MKQIKTAWAVLKAFFSVPESEDATDSDRYSIWATAEQLKDAPNVTVLTPATRRKYKMLRDIRKFKINSRSKK